MSAVTKLMTAGGGGVALTPASSIASDVTVNVPSQNCTLGIQGPAFSAYSSAAQNISNATLTKVTLDVEEFDTSANFASSRFTPTVAGYYQANFATYIDGGPSECILYKNGAVYKAGSFVSNIAAVGSVSTGSALVYLNGTTDYIELYTYQNTGVTAAIQASAGYTYFQAALVRAA